MTGQKIPVWVYVLGAIFLIGAVSGKLALVIISAMVVMAFWIGLGWTIGTFIRKRFLK